MQHDCKMTYENMYMILKREHYDYVLNVIHDEIKKNIIMAKDEETNIRYIYESHYALLHNAYRFLLDISSKHNRNKYILTIYNNASYIKFTNSCFEFINEIIYKNELNENFALPLFVLPIAEIDYTDCIDMNITYTNNKKQDKIKIHKSIKLFEAIIFDRLSCSERYIDELECPSIRYACEKIAKLTLTCNPCDVIETFKRNCYNEVITDLKNNTKKFHGNIYTELTEYIKKNTIIIHNDKDKKFCILKKNEDIINFINRMIQNKTTLSTLTENDCILDLGSETKHFKKKYMVGKNTRNVFKCPCIFDLPHEKYVTCSYYIDINTTMSLATLDVMNRINNDSSNNVNKLNLINELKLISTLNCLNTDRCFPTCPKCEHIFLNKPGLDSEQLIDCEKVHPTQVICPSCNYLFCTDCKESHPDFICRGNTIAEDTRACPGCKIGTVKLEGCPYMVCTNTITIYNKGNEIKTRCGMQWCYTCRLPRGSEYFNTVHYCPLTDHYKSNPKWRNNNNFKALKLPDDMK